MKSLKDELTAQPTTDLTPMIDVVFQLIIFFMLIIDLSQSELEDLQLPASKMAVKDEHPEEGRLYVNVSRKGEYVVKRQQLDIDQLYDELRARVDLPRPGGLPVRDAAGLSERPLLVRADRATEFKHVQKVLYQCGREGLKIWKVELAAGRENPERPERPERQER